MFRRFVWRMWSPSWARFQGSVSTGNLPEARGALTKAGEFNANYKTLAKFKATDLSDNAVYVEQRKHVEDGLLKAGLVNE